MCPIRGGLPVDLMRWLAAKRTFGAARADIGEGLALGSFFGAIIQKIRSDA
jgi:hypothetical protein